MKRTSLPFLAVIALVTVLAAHALRAGDPRTNNPNPEPPRTPPGVTNRAHPVQTRPNRPQQLQSNTFAPANTNAPLPEAANAPAPPPAPKLIGIVMYDIYAVQANAQTPPLLVVPERYLHDLTNHYRYQYVPVLRLEEP